MTLLEAIQSALTEDRGFTFRMDTSLRIVATRNQMKPDAIYFTLSFGRLLTPNGVKTGPFVLNVVGPETESDFKTRTWQTNKTHPEKQIRFRKEFDPSTPAFEILNETEGFVACLLVNEE